MPHSGAQTVTAMAAQPTVTVANGATAGQVVTVNLRYMGSKPFVPADLLNALVVQYGAGKVSASTDLVGQGQYNFDVIA